MRLPPELRDHIYDMIFEDTLIAFNVAFYYRRGVRAFSAPGILLACHQVHDEATGIFYAKTLFIAHHMSPLENWFLCCQSRSNRHLSSIHAELRMIDFTPSLILRRLTGSREREYPYGLAYLDPFYIS